MAAILSIIADVFSAIASSLWYKNEKNKYEKEYGDINGRKN